MTFAEIIKKSSLGKPLSGCLGSLELNVEMYGEKIKYIPLLLNKSTTMQTTESMKMKWQPFHTFTMQKEEMKR